MNTTIGKFFTGIQMLQHVDFDGREVRQAIGRKLYATGEPYGRCRTDAERDGYVAAQSEALALREAERVLA